MIEFAREVIAEGGVVPHLFFPDPGPNHPLEVTLLDPGPGPAVKEAVVIEVDEVVGRGGAFPPINVVVFENDTSDELLL